MDQKKRLPGAAAACNSAHAKVCFVAPSGSGGVPADAPRPRATSRNAFKICWDYKRRPSLRPDSGDEEARSFELPDGQIIQVLETGWAAVLLRAANVWRQVQEKIRTGATEILFGGDGESDTDSLFHSCWPRSVLVFSGHPCRRSAWMPSTQWTWISDRHPISEAEMLVLIEISQQDLVKSVVVAGL